MLIVEQASSTESVVEIVSEKVLIEAFVLTRLIFLLIKVIKKVWNTVIQKEALCGVLGKGITSLILFIPVAN
tara:strand:- start:30 stop:245 length:216 start_codon:yes stop_codon:yes gene_type:complete